MDIWSNKIIARDIQEFVDIFNKYGACSLFNVNKLVNIAELLPFVDYCDIEEIEIEFYNYKPISKTVPKIKHFKINLINSIKSIPNTDLNVKDPIEKCTFDIVITGFCDNDKEYINCWHLDKDIRDEEDGEAKYTHPLYHFQYGGKYMGGLNDTGDTLLMGAPRIPHPPMDIFLAIHFILNNYFNKNEDDYICLQYLFADEGYQDILETAKRRMWYPYFEGLSNSSNTNEDLNLANLFPLAVSP